MTLLLCALSIASVAQQTPEEVFLQANQAYDDGEFARAVELYEEVAADGGAGHVHYNLGNAYLRAGALGQAIAAYRAAEAELPRDGDLAANLAFARQAAKDAIAAPEAPAVLKTVFFWHFFLGRSEQLTALAILNVLFWMALAARRLRPDTEWLAWIVWGTGLPLVALAGSVVWHLVRPAPVAVVVADQIDVRAGTNEDAVVRFTLHEGTEARVVDRYADWVRLSLSDDNSGWVPESAVVVVEGQTRVGTEAARLSP